MSVRNEPGRLRELVHRRERRRRRGDRMYRTLDAIFFAALLTGVLGFFAFLARMVAPTLTGPYG